MPRSDERRRPGPLCDDARVRPFALLALTVSLAACRTPTQVTVEVTTDVACDGDQLPGEPFVRDTAIVTGPVDGFRDSDRPPAASTTLCTEDGEIGDLVVVPSGDKRGSVGVRVHIGLRDKSADDCARQCGEDCIEASRRLSFVPNSKLVLPIRANRSCIGVCCPEGQTCLAGDCVSDEIDACEDGACLPEPPPGSVKWSRGWGGAGDERIEGLDASGGNLFVVGEHTDSFSLGGLDVAAPTGGQGGFLAKVSVDSAPAAAILCAGSDVEMYDVTGNTRGGAYALGTAAAVLDCGTGPLNRTAQSTGFLLEMGSSGGAADVVRFGGTTPTGEIYPKTMYGIREIGVAGVFTGTARITDDGTDITGVHAQDAFVSILESEGRHRWTETILTSDPVQPLFVEPLADLALVAADFAGTVEFSDGTVLTAQDQRDVFAVAYQLSDGAVRWTRHFTGAGSVTLASTGLILESDLVSLAITFDSDVSWSNGGSSSSSPDPTSLLLQLEADGTASQRITQPAHTAGVSAGSIGDMHLVARSVDTSENRVIALTPLEDDPLANWTRQLGGAGTFVTGLDPASPANGRDLAVVGYFTGSVAIGETFMSNGGEDLFIGRLTR